MNGQNTGNENHGYCRICNKYKILTKHHLFPKRYMKFLPYYWELKNNIVKICSKCHHNFEKYAEKYYQKIEDSFKDSLSHVDLNRLNSVNSGLFSHDIKAKSKKMLDILENDRQRFKFIIVIRYQFVKFFNSRLKHNIVSPAIRKHCDDSLKEYLNIKE